MDDDRAYAMSQPEPQPAPPPVPPMPPAPPAPPPRPHDPLAVALGNASFLGAGYLLMRRYRWAAAALAGTVVLVFVLLSYAEPWCEVLLLLWWAAGVGHGWFLAGGRGRRLAVRRERLVALGVTVPVLLATALLRYDTSVIDGDMTGARASGDCAGVVSAQEKTWFGNRLADAPLAARGERMAETCERLERAAAKLTSGLVGDTDALRAGFDLLAEVRAQPGNEKTVDVVLNGFLDSLPTRNPCPTAKVTDWLRDHTPGHPALDRSEETVRQAAPGALVECADDHMVAEEWKKARARYEQLLDQYPDDSRADAARKGAREATQTIELENVTELLEGGTGHRPEYCDKPAKYSGAKAYGKGTNRAMFFGNAEYTDQLPGGWRTTDPAKAVLVVCAGEAEDGDAVRTCPYEHKLAIGGVQDVTFHKIDIPVQVYELRTGKKVADRTVQISGTSCPAVLEYETIISADIGPPSDIQVEASKGDVRAGFESLIDR
ncbi:tol-pal system YbgF family protein [Streptomyces sp. Ru87]|uniref:tetratricopeptide repeat protein n=1 Tax=Streptomyces sp. Ru87 TaxID=2044307 RepID=UPI000BF354D5|nr:hypothetical protein [Streptomyces sp. Ru87]PGH47091.1 hypothetical protein CRI70_30350 [Streptomyces sp. Ru87]